MQVIEWCTLLLEANQLQLIYLFGYIFFLNPKDYIILIRAAFLMLGSHIIDLL